MIRKALPIVFLITCYLPFTKAQDTVLLPGTTLLYGIILDGDTILYSQIEEIYIFRTPKFENKRDWRRYHRLVRNVKVVFPYAKMAGEKYDSVEAHFMTLHTEKEKKAYIKQVEQEIMDEYEDDLKGLTITQGRILLKLIDREVGETSYDLLKEFKGFFSAFFWQTLARIFGHNLKSEFDPEIEDKLLNEIVILIENGQL
jgi:hypothetical protein